MADIVKLTGPQVETLGMLAFRSKATWWHDIHPSTREALWRVGLIEAVPSAPCNTHGHGHPGYVVISTKGRRAMETQAEANADREIRRSGGH